jgi:hypothetical protein
MGRILTTPAEGKTNKHLADRLDAIQQRLELTTPADLAFKVESRSGGSYSRWYKRPPTSFPRFKVLFRFASLGVNLNFLVFGEQPVMRSDALPIEASIARLRQAVIDNIRKQRSLSKSAEASIPSGERFVELVTEAVRKTL